MQHAETVMQLPPEINVISEVAANHNAGIGVGVVVAANHNAGIGVGVVDQLWHHI